VKRGKAKVYLTASFERNLESIREFLAAADALPALDALVSELSDNLIPTLERFPDLGAEFTGRAPLSVEGRALFERLVALAGDDGEVRQLIEGDYVVLYLVRGGSVYLLSIRHHRQVSFDFASHWP
jgi:plasmid stabilization system protein ParE